MPTLKGLQHHIAVTERENKKLLARAKCGCRHYGRSEHALAGGVASLGVSASTDNGLFDIVVCQLDWRIMSSIPSKTTSAESKGGGLTKSFCNTSKSAIPVARCSFTTRYGIQALQCHVSRIPSIHSVQVNGWRAQNETSLTTASAT